MFSMLCCLLLSSCAGISLAALKYSDEQINSLLNDLPSCNCVLEKDCRNGSYFGTSDNAIERMDVQCTNGRVCCNDFLTSPDFQNKNTPRSIEVPTPSERNYPRNVSTTTTKKNGNFRIEQHFPTAIISRPTTESNPNPLPSKPGNTKYSCGTRKVRDIYERFDSDSPEMASIGEFPWTVSINGMPKDKPRYIGVGSLIHPRAVLTVAHHFRKRVNRGNLFIRAGTNERSRLDALVKFVDSEVEKIEVHEEYDSGYLANDVAILFLATPVEAGPTIGFACLPPASQTPRPGTWCLASGWGAHVEGGGLQDAQKIIDAVVVDREDCQYAVSQDEMVNPLFRISPTMLCARGRYQTTCRGDGGAPLVCPYPEDPAHYYQAGIASWGLKCSQLGLPSMYSSVAEARTWIDTEMAAKNLSKIFYEYLPDAYDDDEEE